MEKLTQGYQSLQQLSTVYFTRLGEVLHYIADYFTFPHNKEYDGNMKAHCVYEGRLKHQLRSYIRQISEQDISRWKKSLQLERIHEFRSVADICEYIKSEHKQYIRRGRHTVEEDCKYIVGICSKIALAILSLCIQGIEAGYEQNKVKLQVSV